MSNLHNKTTNQIKLISECFVKPKYEVEASKQPYNLCVVDLFYLNFYQIQQGLLFSTKPKNIQSDFLAKLKNSLAYSLVYYYPLSGRLSTEDLLDENAKWVYIDCSKGPGARLTHAVVEYSVSDILSSVDVHPIVRSFFDLGEKAINRDGHTRPLLSIQVTELIDGVFIGFTMNHSTVDGTSQWHFINSLSEIFLQLNQSQTNGNKNEILLPTISRKPVFKPLIPDGRGPFIKLTKSNPFLDGPSPSKGNEGILRERIFHFSSKSISKLKSKANQECEARSTISSFQALIAFMWMSITRARNLQPDQETACGFVMDSRSRLSPSLSSDYFGNYILKDLRRCKVGEVLSKDFGSVCMLVNQMVANLDDKKVREFNEMAVKFLSDGVMDPAMGELISSPNLVGVGGSARFNCYGPDFGLGKAEIVLAGYCSKEDGKITATPGHAGDGSVDLEVCLKPEFMDALELDEDFMSFVTLV